MPYRPLKIAIPEPCHEDWEEMQPVEGASARHCRSCEKNVVDFTGFTDAQMHAYARKNGNKMCGRFRPDQLNRPMRAAAEPTKNPLRIAATAAGLMLAATGCDSVPSALQPNLDLRKIEVVGGIAQGPITGGITIQEISGSMEASGILEEESVEITAAPAKEEKRQDLKKEDAIDDHFTGDTLLPTPICSNTEEDFVMGLFISIDWPEPINKLGFRDQMRSLLPTPPALFSKEPPLHPRPRPAPIQQKEVTVFPNPFVDYFTVEVIVYELEKLTVELLDNSGRRVHVQAWEPNYGKQSLRIQPLQQLPGHSVYYLRISNGKKFSTTKLLTR